MTQSPSFSVAGIYEALAQQPPKGNGAGRALMIVSPKRKRGVTTAARVLAEAAQGAATYAIDLDLKRNALAKLLGGEVGLLGPRIDGALNGHLFYTLRDASGAVVRERETAFSYRRVGRTRIFAGVFDATALAPGVRLTISAGAAYWDAARAGGATVVVDAPALERSQIALRVARHMDGVVLVVGAEPGDAPAAVSAKDALVAAGANVIGLVYAGAPAPAPVAAIERLLRQAG